MSNIYKTSSELYIEFYLSVLHYFVFNDAEKIDTEYLIDAEIRGILDPL